MKKYIIYILVSITHTLYSQLLIDTAYCNFDSVNYYYFPKTNIAFSNLRSNAGVFRFTNAVDLIEENVFKYPSSNVKHHLFKQYKNGVPILNSEISIREIRDTIISATGLLNQNVPNMPAAFSASQAVQYVVNHTNFYKYKWQDEAWETSIKEERRDENATYYPKPSLVIYKLDKNDFSNPDNYRLAYFVTISAMVTSETPYRDSTYILDAINGQIINRFCPFVSCSHKKERKPTSANSIIAVNTYNTMPPICQQDCMAITIPIQYYGSQTIYTEKFLHAAVNCTHRLKDNCTGTYLYVKYYNGNVEEDFRNNANTWGNNGYAPTDKDGATALWSLRQTHDFFRLWLGRNSYDSAYSQIKILMNATNGTSWSLTNNYMEIDFSSGTTNSEITLDIIGHEVSHGVTDNACYLMQDGNVANNDEERALGEGFGDIFGQGVEYYVSNNYSTSGALNDFYHGSNLPNLLNRSLSNPKSTGNPDTYGQTNWIQWWDNANASDFGHRNSTILSHWFYLVSIGGSGTNDIPNSYCVQPLGQYKALQIAYLSLYYLRGTPKQFINARNATIQAADELYGANSNEVAQVTHAWYAVGVGADFSGIIDISNHTATGTENYNYNSAIHVQNFNANSGSNVEITSNTEIVFLPDVEINSGAEFHAYIAPACNGVGARMANTSNNETPETAIEMPQHKNLNIKENASEFSIIPNPNNGEFKLVLSETPSSVNVVSPLGVTVYENKQISSNEININLKGVAKGLYIVKVNAEGKTLSKKIVID